MTNQKTPYQLMTEALACRDPQEADTWFVGEMEHILEDPGYFNACVAQGLLPTAETARGILRALLGWMTGDYDLDTAERIYMLFRIEHPVLGTPEQRAAMSPLDMLKSGMDLYATHQRAQRGPQK